MTTRSATVRQRPHKRQLLPRPRLIEGRPAGASGIRWDRVGRFVVLGVCLLVVLLYVRPLAAIWSARGEAATRKTELTKLQRENAALTGRVEALKNPAALEREARSLGMVKPGEKAYVIKGLPGSP
ncbi:MAG: septum formation initiator family protein [Solirubrobacteraceae bacterium]|jgi:cell division protein FtsB|nr:septum formation initiator family protein [Solirubrobacteraceae bacterium]MDP4673215.1 septum formation initiator family protein [Solirubrobacteraceae bacterium]MDP4920772.1 septum formation initiator family protein [Solirubrobacteraceae bacterium]MDP5033546.1 septum formation initiator family protein [Solirubrobacteraceae bacterium]